MIPTNCGDAFGLVDDMMGVSAEVSLGLSVKTSAVVWFLEETDDDVVSRLLRAAIGNMPS